MTQSGLRQRKTGERLNGDIRKPRRRNPAHPKRTSKGVKDPRLTGMAFHRMPRRIITPIWMRCGVSYILMVVSPSVYVDCRAFLSLKAAITLVASTRNDTPFSGMQGRSTVECLVRYAVHE